MRANDVNFGFTPESFTKNILFLDISDPVIAEKSIAQNHKDDPLVKLEANNIRLVATSDIRFGIQRIAGGLNPPQMENWCRLIQRARRLMFF